MRFSAAAALAFVTFNSACNAVIVSAGQSVWAPFTMTPGGATLTPWAIDLNTRLPLGTSFRFRVYEDMLGTAVYDHTFPPRTNPNILGFIFHGQNDNGYFQDREGSLQIDVLAGSMDLNRIFIFT